VRHATPHCDTLISLVDLIHSMLFLIDPVSQTGASVISIRFDWNDSRADVVHALACDFDDRRLSIQPLSPPAQTAPIGAGDSGDRPDLPADDSQAPPPRTAPVASAAIGSVVGFFICVNASSRSNNVIQRRGETN
jgi:hypothetical protein